MRAGLDLDSDGNLDKQVDTTFELLIRACKIDNVITEYITPRKYMVRKPELEIGWDNF